MGPSQGHKMQYLFLMEREFHELLSHEELMNALSGQNKGQLERIGIQNNKAALFGVWTPPIVLWCLSSTSLHRFIYSFRNNLLSSAACTDWDCFFMCF